MQYDAALSALTRMKTIDLTGLYVTELEDRPLPVKPSGELDYERLLGILWEHYRHV